MCLFKKCLRLLKNTQNSLNKSSYVDIPVIITIKLVSRQSNLHIVNLILFFLPRSTVIFDKFLGKKVEKYPTQEISFVLNGSIIRAATHSMAYPDWRLYNKMWEKYVARTNWILILFPFFLQRTLLCTDVKE